MSRHLDYRDLEPLKRRCALMRAAGMSEQVIGHFLDTDYMTVSYILKKPRVSRYLIALESTFVNEIGPSAKHLTAAIEQEAVRAFQVERDVMERLFAMEEDVKAQMGAASTAQDILNRAGKRAPTKIESTVTHTIDAEALAHVASVLLEVNPPVDVTPNGGEGSDRREDRDGEELYQGRDQETRSLACAARGPTGTEDSREEDRGGGAEGREAGPEGPIRADAG